MYRQDATFKTLIPVFVFGSLVLAAVVPAILLLSSRMPPWHRVGYLIRVWCLLLFELYWTFLTVLIAR